MDTITKLAEERLTTIVYISNQKICTSEPIQTLPFLSLHTNKCISIIYYLKSVLILIKTDFK
jgi:hypothetical protein